MQTSLVTNPPAATTEIACKPLKDSELSLQSQAAPRSSEEMQSLYDAYFASNDYDLRYPQPNPSTMKFLERHGAMQARFVLDFGCGSGRYAVPFLKQSDASLTACDISASAISVFSQRIKDSPLASRIDLVHGGLDKVSGDARFDAIFLLFGVLSHVGLHAERVTLLRHLRERATQDCRLFVSVPSIWRRRPLELLGSVVRRGREMFGDIRFSRFIAGERRSFHYHLYSPASLKAELAEAGWRLEAREAESVFPEYLVTRSRVIGRVDRLLQPFAPAVLGYGIRALARPDVGSVK